MNTFTLYRRSMPKDSHHTDQMKNEGSKPQAQGVIFDDGSCAVKWLTPTSSTSFWASFQDFMTIHGDPKYGTEVLLQTTMQEQKQKDSEWKSVAGVYKNALMGIKNADHTFFRSQLEVRDAIDAIFHEVKEPAS